MFLYHKVRRNTFKYNKDPLKLKMAVRNYSKALIHQKFKQRSMCSNYKNI